MSEASDRRRLRAEARRYGMGPKRGTSATDLDREIQNKVAEDLRAGICSACRKALHDGGC